MLIAKIEGCWKQRNVYKGSPMKRLQFNKSKLKIWNKDFFKNIFAENLSLEDELYNLNEKIIKHDMFIEDYIKEKKLRAPSYLRSLQEKNYIGKTRQEKNGTRLGMLPLSFSMCWSNRKY